MQNISNQSHQFILDAALEGGLCRKLTGVWNRAYFYISMTVAALERHEEKTDIPL